MAMAAANPARGMGSRGSSRSFLFSTAVPPAPPGPRPDTGAGPGNGKRRPIARRRGQERVRDGSGSLRAATDSRGRREREGEGRKVGEGEKQRIGGQSPHRPHCHRQEVTTLMTLGSAGNDDSVGRRVCSIKRGSRTAVRMSEFSFRRARDAGLAPAALAPEGALGSLMRSFF